jgi:hypothetical protein
MNRAAMLVLVAALFIARSSAIAQTADSAQCYGFAFGPWKPPLDLLTAGHDSLRPDLATPKAPGGRDWASDIVPNDTTLLLFPAWWPAGIQVFFSRRPQSAADTVTGRAVALVANGSVEPPRAVTRLWRVTCR